MNGGQDSPRPARLIAVGVAAGLLSGILGVGGGVIMVPLMVGVLRFDQHRAHATSLAAIILIALAGAVRFGLAGEVDWSVGLALGVGGLIGSTIGANVMDRLSPAALRALFGVIMVLAGLRMVFGGDPAAGASPEPLLGAVIGIGIGLGAGIASGVAGIGGGVIMVPAMVFLLGVSQHTAEGTSLVAILFAALAGTRVNLRNQRVRPADALIVGAGGVLSAVAGASLALALPAGVLAQVFGIFVTSVGIRMVVAVYRDRRRTARP